MWQDLFAAARSAQSNEYLDSLACRPPLSASSSGDPALGISRDTVFTHYLSPDSLVQHHRLGKPEVRRLYQALQVYSLGFHQGMLDLTRHAGGKGLLLLAIWRAFAMLWDGALQVWGGGAGDQAGAGGGILGRLGRWVGSETGTPSNGDLLRAGLTD